jgi:hypothetical protein
MTEKDNKRDQLLNFIDKKAFDPIIKAKPEDFPEKERDKLEDIQRKTENEKKQFHKDFNTAQKVKKGFLSDVRSPSAKKLNKDLEHLGLPTLPELKSDFEKLCNELEV